MIKESFNLTGCEYFGLQLVNQNFPQRKTENCNIFHFRLLPAKSNNKILWKVKSAQLWVHFASFWANKNFWKIHFCHFFLFPDFYCGSEFQKKLMNRIQEKLFTYVQTNDTQNKGCTDKHEFIRPPLLGGPKSFNIQLIQYLNLFLKHT